MLTYPEIDPVAISFGPLKVHWYGLMYLVGFFGGWWLARRRAARPGSGWSAEQIDDLLFYVALGVVAGGRVGYMLFYDFGALAQNPLSLFFVWQGGMSFHGGLLGVLAAIAVYVRREKRGWLATVDFVAPVVPVGLAAGRIGNFINGELWGKASDLPWAMVFPTGGPVPRHPSQLYEFALEGVVLFVILWLYSSKPRPTGAVAGMFGLCYGLFRFAVEFVRVPDFQIGYLAANWFTLGQLLSLPLIVVGAWLLWSAYRQQPAQA